MEEHELWYDHRVPDKKPAARQTFCVLPARRKKYVSAGKAAGVKRPGMMYNICKRVFPRRPRGNTGISKPAGEGP